ncbi:MAG: hypothetical protein QN163_00605 [Armatimonadota bacterium]|nr:hypothetical protein [Armatimonadota bacterium]MDR5696732.1 hypothetical protein [Armatimonadota bacterium]
MGLRVRESEPGDGPDLAELDRSPGAGALPAEWDLWADEPHRTIVAVRGGQVVGAAHVAMVGRAEGWVEGVRTRTPGEVETEDALVREALALARRYGALVVRACAPASAPSGWLRRHGFEQVAAFDVLVADASPVTAPPDVEIVRRNDGAAWIGWLRKELAERTGGLMALGWRFRRFADEIAAGAARESRLLAQRDPAGVALFLRRGVDRVVNVLVCAQPWRLLDAVCADLPAEGRVATFAPRESEESRRLREEGFASHQWCTQGLAVFARTDVR